MANAKILIIDDEQELLDLLKMMLETEEYEVITAKDGKEGVEKFKEHKPELIICDIIMPKMDGYEVLREIRKISKKWIPIIMLSAITEFAKISQAYKDDANFYITKPVDPLILSKNIKTLLMISRGEAE